MTGDLISIIVPVYNEAATVGIVIARLLAAPLPAPREIIVIDDGSRDGTSAVLAALDADERARPRPLLRVVALQENRGKGHAVRIGLARAAGTVVAIQDADLELDPGQIAELVAPIFAGEAGVVYGSRFLHGSGASAGLPFVGNRVLTSLTNLLFGAALTDMETGYKVMRSDIARSLELTCDGFDIEAEITAQLLRRGHRIVERPVRFTPRSRAAGKKIRWQDGVRAIAVLVSQRLRRTA